MAFRASRGSYTHLCIHCNGLAYQQCCVCEALLCGSCALTVRRRVYCQHCGSVKKRVQKQSSK